MDEQNCTLRSCMNLLVTECGWVVNTKTVGRMGQEKFTGEMKNVHKIPV
jgi:hypothetical protein